MAISNSNSLQKFEQECYKLRNTTHLSRKVDNDRVIMRRGGRVMLFRDQRLGGTDQNTLPENEV